MDYITNERYAENVDARCSKEFHFQQVSPKRAAKIVKTAIDALQKMDWLKKNLFYRQVPHSNPHKCTKVEQLFHAIFGIASEAGELLEALQKGAFTDNQFDEINLREEAGDVMWYVQLLLNTIGSNLSECMTINDNKLEKRYGPAFSSDRANNRDLDAEREELER